MHTCTNVITQECIVSEEGRKEGGREGGREGGKGRGGREGGREEGREGGRERGREGGREGGEGREGGDLVQYMYTVSVVNKLTKGSHTHICLTCESSPPPTHTLINH